MVCSKSPSAKRATPLWAAQTDFVPRHRAPISSSQRQNFSSAPSSAFIAAPSVGCRTSRGTYPRRAPGTGRTFSVSSTCREPLAGRNARSEPACTFSFSEKYWIPAGSENRRSREYRSATAALSTRHPGAGSRRSAIMRRMDLLGGTTHGRTAHFETNESRRPDQKKLTQEGTHHRLPVLEIERGRVAAGE